ncbi:hypothetical protein [Arthrobacter russicus]|uniref:Uncharacterized protein n=1 Tax=Arthrobacter russicus TaxID=172040 RepID=A0ABU1J788_9MICC|nr:hypothetical protein [Arthrobacter russicus]MBQ1443865.1 hypothetical protein [Renibacterium sp.]MDR6268228.1 hypothetical protein [Arthrobacter russicus]
MSTNQLFIATHHEASRYARDGGPKPKQLLDLGEATDLDLEVLGELAVKTVHATGTETALGMVDVDLDHLMVLPDALAEVLAELPTLEDQEEVSELAAAWAATEEFATTPAVAEPLLRSIASMAGQVVAADEDARLALYYITV